MKVFARLQQRLLTDDSLSYDLLHFSVRIGDDPMPIQQLCGHRAIITYPNGIGKNIVVVFR